MGFLEYYDFYFISVPIYVAQNAVTHRVVLKLSKSTQRSSMDQEHHFTTWVTLQYLKRTCFVFVDSTQIQETKLVSYCEVV
jgi:hypothetical protein